MFRRSLPWAALGCLLASCSSRAHPPGIADLPADATPRVDSGTPPPRDGCADVGAAPSPDAQGLCGNKFLEVTSDPPNLYFVIDRSGSMAAEIDGHRKYDLVATAAVALVRSLGSRANVGAAWFPVPPPIDSISQADQCLTGTEVFTTRPGDSILGGLCGNDGEVTRAFSNSISIPYEARLVGGTPTAATLAHLLPTLVGLRGRTVVLLATDGGPNCNPKAGCDATKCIPNIEGAMGCTPAVNCCANAQDQCLDDDATVRAVESLASRGIKTYVVGIPGSGPYASVLNALAVAGGTARTGMAASYYDVEHVSELDEVLATIGATATLSCHVQLATPPPDWHLVRVYLDGQEQKYGPNGWIWADGDAGTVDDAASTDANDLDGAASSEASDSTDAGDFSDDAFSSADGAIGADGAIEMESSPPTTAAPHTRIELVGTACDMLKSGKYRRLQIVFGCPTDIPR